MNPLPFAGTPPDVIARAFDPFFTTEPTGVADGRALGVAGEEQHLEGGTLLPCRIGKLPSVHTPGQPDMSEEETNVGAGLWRAAAVDRGALGSIIGLLGLDLAVPGG